MREKSKALAVIALLAAPAPAVAADGPCGLLAAMTPFEVRSGLLALGGPVLGLFPDMWSAAEFENLVAHAKACHGKPDGVQKKVSADQWERELRIAEQALAPISAMSAEARSAYAGSWSWGDVPSCISLLEWRRDADWLDDNAREIFGADLEELDADGLEAVAGVASACVPVMEESVARRGMRRSIARQVSEDIAAASVRVAEGRASPSLPPHLTATRDGRTVPLSHLGAGGREAVGIAVEAERRGRRLTTEEMVVITKWAEQAARRSGPDAAYAEVLRNHVSRQMFGD